jgi:hypothetical protein
MSKRNWILVAFVAGAAAAIGGIIYLTARDRPKPGGGSESVAGVFEPKVAAPTVMTWEYGQKRDWGVYAYREQRGGQ